MTWQADVKNHKEKKVKLYLTHSDLLMRYTGNRYAQAQLRNYTIYVEQLGPPDPKTVPSPKSQKIKAQNHAHSGFIPPFSNKLCQSTTDI